ncbi:transcript variant X2 [Nothobranchius furzeri]|uniref:Transcript variant X2 n=1 Tax=Nothobranchius furzeri TaxID=105023 RepID=A0A9D2XH09_NOTFU|nr:transcript variant X2 [Nothobranchius furzeri]
MVTTGVCCASLKDSRALMKMGLALVLVGHVNFLLGALVHGAVLRGINILARTQILVSAITNVIAMVAGLMGIISGIAAIVLSKNKKNKILMWVLLVFSFLAGLLGVASTVGLSVSTVQVFRFKGTKLLNTYCSLDESTGSSSVTYECPFDPTRIYPTIAILWVPLIVMSVVEVVFTFRCFAISTSFLYLCPCRKKPKKPTQAKNSVSIYSCENTLDLHTTSRCSPLITRSQSPHLPLPPGSSTHPDRTPPPLASPQPEELTRCLTHFKAEGT